MSPNPYQFQVCEWFARCVRRATTTRPHPILGDVPICAKCADWYDRMDTR